MSVAQLHIDYFLHAAATVAPYNPMEHKEYREHDEHIEHMEHHKLQINII